MYFVYILQSMKNGKFYVGSSVDVEKRMMQHNAEKSRSTKAGAPWRIVQIESFATRAEATRREKKIKARGVERYLVGKSLMLC